MNQRFNRTGMAIGLMFVTGVLAPAAFAQSQPTARQQTPATPMMQQPDAGPAPSQQELQHFVNAALDVQKIGQAARPQIKAATSRDERTKLTQAMEAKMKTAVRSHHLSVKRYKQIFVAMNTDNDVRQKIAALVKKNKE